MTQNIIFLALLLLGCGYAAARGGAPERWCAALLVVALFLSNIAMAVSGRHYGSTEIGAMTVDIVLALALTVLALCAQRYWPMWIAAVQIDAVATHVLMYSATTGAFSYAFALWFWSLPAPILLGIGTLRHRERLRRYGTDPAWTPTGLRHDR